jgi:cytoskeletal protein RodZ
MEVAMKFSLRSFSLNRLSRRALLGTAAVLAFTGAAGAAALLAPGDLGFSRLVPAVSAQAITPRASNDISELPFDRVAQAPVSAPQSSNDTPSTTEPQAAPAPVAPGFERRAEPTSSTQRQTPAGPAARAPSTNAPLAQAPATRAPIGQQAPAARAPIAQAPIGAPQGEMVPTASPGVIGTAKPVAQTKFVTPVKKIFIPRPEHICND